MGVPSSCWVCGTASRPDPAYARTAYHRCPSCGLLFAAGRAGEDAGRLYDAGYFDAYPGGEAYDADDAQRVREAERRVRFVRAHAPGGRLLEVGAASGRFLQAAAGGGYAATGIEPAAEVARDGARRLGVDLRPGRLEDAELEASAYDVVCAWHVLEHLLAPRAAARRLRALLAPGGVALLELPNVASVAAVRAGEAWFHLDPRHHVALYTPEALRRLLAEAGFERVAIETVSALGYLRPGRALRPRGLAAFAKEWRRVGRPPWRPDPARHEFLRAVARVR